MNNVDKAMELAQQLAADSENWKAYTRTEQQLRTHLEAMEADRVRLLEALKKCNDTLTDPRIGQWTYMEGSEIYSDFKEASDAAKSAIAQSEAQS